MKLSLRWLSRHVDLEDIEPKQILADLTMSTAEIEGLERFGEGLECLVVGHVRSREKHPDADKLSVCQVDLGHPAHGEERFDGMVLGVVILGEARAEEEGQERVEARVRWQRVDARLEVVAVSVGQVDHRLPEQRVSVPHEVP